MGKEIRIGYLIGILVTIFLFGIGANTVKADEYDGGPVKIIYDFIGHYSLNYTGNTNHYDYWNANGTTRLVSRNYKDRTDISTVNNSTAMIRQTDDESTMKAAYLVWQSRSKDATKNPIVLISPSGEITGVIAKWVCQDTRTNGAGDEYVGVYTMCAEVTDLVCSENGGYGTYTVANIPVWDGAEAGDVSCGGESVASWQLVVVEESPNFPLRTISLNTLSQYFFNIDYTVTVNFADASSPNGEVSAQFLDGEINVDCQQLYDGVGYPDDYNYFFNETYFRYLTQMRGLYKNGICFNNRDTGELFQTGANAIGATRVHLFDDKRRANNTSSQELKYQYAGTNMGTNIFLFGVSIDILAYEIVFDGNDADSGSMEELVCIYGRGYHLPENQYKKEHYKFAGWNTKADGSGISYKNGQYVRNLTTIEDKVILYAQWEPDTYKITLDIQQAVVKGTGAYYEWYGIGNYVTEKCTETITKITVPQKKGFKFNGYYTEKGGNGEMWIDERGKILSSSTTFIQNTTLYAYWAAGIYKITLDNQGADTTGTTQYFEKFDVGNYTTEACTTVITKIELPIKEHHIFHGYFTEKNGRGVKIIDEKGNITDSPTMFTKDTTLYAYWKPNTYTITLNPGSGVTSFGTLKYFEKYGVMNYYSELSHGDGLYSETVTFNYTGAMQAFIAPKDGTYDLLLYGASSTSEYSDGSTCVTGQVVLKEGEVLYVYVGGAGDGDAGGWNGGGNGAILYDSQGVYVKVSAGSGATDIRRGGTDLSNRILVAGGGGGDTFYKNVQGNIFIKEANNSYLRVGDRSNVISQFVDMAPSWMDEDWKPTNGMINYLVNTSVDYDETVGMALDRYTFIEEVYKETMENGGYGSGGGYRGGRSFRIVYNKGSNELQAITTSSYGECYLDGVINGEIHGGNSDYATRMGDGLASIIYETYLEGVNNRVATHISIPKKIGYHFRGYYDSQGNQWIDENGKILASPTTFTEDTTLTARWKNSSTSTNSYYIQFNGNGADAGTMEMMTCEIGSYSKPKYYTLAENTFTRTGYQFAGWSKTSNGVVEYNDKERIANLSTIKGEVVTLYAVWMEGNASYKVRHFTENLDESWYLDSMDTQVGTTASSVVLSTLKKSMSGFTYQYATANDIVEESATILADGSLVIDLYYTRNSYTVTLDKDSGISAVEGAGLYKYGEMVLLDATLKEGFSWANWSGTFHSTERCYEFIMPANHVTMKANTHPYVYTIYLDNQQANESGTLQYYEKYNIGNYEDVECTTAITTIVLPKRIGYTFGGYYTKKDGHGTKYVDTSGKILAASNAFVEDTVLYARWTPITYTIHFEGNEATSGSMADMNCTYDISYRLSGNQFVKDKYKFVGWNTKADGTGLTFTDKAYVEKLCENQGDCITLYAIWSPNTYLICFDANGGEGVMDDISAYYHMTQTLPENRYTNKNEYGQSAFLGWNTDANATAALYVDGDEVMNIQGCESGFVTLYAIWDHCPWIVATDLYYSLYEAQNGLVTYEELISHASAYDLEDGSLLLPGIDEEKGTSFMLIDYLTTDFTQFRDFGSVTETFRVVDSAGNEYRKMITVHVVDTEAVEIQPVGTTRFINEKYYGEPYEYGGLQKDSIWKNNPEYVEIIKKTFENLKNGTPLMSLSFSYEEMLKMKEFIRVNGLGNTKYADALQRFYEEFMVEF